MARLPRGNNKKAEWISNRAKELEGLEEGPKAEIGIDLLRMTLKKISIWKTPRISSPFKQTTTQNEQMSTRNTRTRMDDQRKDHTDTKRPPKRNHPKQLQTNNVPTYDVENTNSTNKGRELLLANKSQIFPGEQKGCHKGSKSAGELLYIDQHIFNESKTRRKNLWPGLTKKKAYNVVPQSWIINCLKMYEMMKPWKPGEWNWQ